MPTTSRRKRCAGSWLMSFCGHSPRSTLSRRRPPRPRHSNSGKKQTIRWRCTWRIFIRSPRASRGSAASPCPAAKPHPGSPSACRFWPHISTKGRRFAWRGRWKQHKESEVMQVRALIVAVLVAVFLEGGQDSQAASHKTHAVFLGAPKHVPYSKTGDPAGAAADEKELKIRALIVDGVVKEWTTGESHDVTDRSFVIRRALRLNDSLPGDKPAATGRWVWQRGPWILIDRSTGHVTALKLPDYDPGVSQVSWFRDYAAYCGLSASGKSLYAVVAQLTVR